MFTVTIQNFDETHISVREWPSVDVIKKGSDRYAQEVDSEAERFELEMGMTTDEAYGLADSYKAVLKSLCGEFAYYMTNDEQAYIVNSSGKTVAVVT